MSGENSIQMQVGKELVAPIVEAKINAAIVEALSDPGAIISDIVKKILCQKVDSEGKRTSSDYHTMSFIEWLCRDRLQLAAKAAIGEWVDENKALLVTEMKKQLSRGKGPFTKSLLDGFAKDFAARFYTRVTIEVPKD